MSNSPMRSLKKCPAVKFYLLISKRKVKTMSPCSRGREGGTLGKSTKVFLHGVIAGIRKGCWRRVRAPAPDTLPCFLCSSCHLGSVSVRLVPASTALEKAAACAQSLSLAQGLGAGLESQQGCSQIVP